MSEEKYTITPEHKESVILPVSGEMQSVWIRDVTTKCNNLSHDQRVLINGNNKLASRILELELQVEAILQALSEE